VFQAKSNLKEFLSVFSFLAEEEMDAETNTLFSVDKEAKF
jgi:hypothetical protein